MKCKHGDGCISRAICAHAGECLSVPSELPPSEPHGQRERSGLATGSLPVSSAEALCYRWEAEAQRCGEQADVANCLIECAHDLRRELARANQRQPEENDRRSDTP